MFANSYAGIVQPEIPNLIVTRARRYQVMPEEIDDLQQQIVPVVSRFVFDPARSNGATRQTALTAVVDRQIKAYLRARTRHEERIKRLQERSRPRAHDCTVVADPSTQPDAIDLRMDLERAFGLLTDRERDICRDLARGATVSSIAKRLNCGRDTIDRAMAHIRQAFELAGLEAWVDPQYRAAGRRAER